MPGDDRNEKPTRAGSMSDADRALSSIKERAIERMANVPDFVVAEDSTPVLVQSHGDRTPVEVPGRPRRPRMTPQEFVESIKEEVRELRGRVDELVTAKLNIRAELAERLVKLETRFDSVVALSGHVESIHDIERELAEFKVAILGSDGTDGKLHAIGVQVGKARSEAQAAPKLIRRVVLWAAGSLLGAIIPCAILINSVVDKASAERSAAAAERATFIARLDASRAEISVLQSGQLLLFRIVNIHRGLDPAGVVP